MNEKIYKPQKYCPNKKIPIVGMNNICPLPVGAKIRTLSKGKADNSAIVDANLAYLKSTYRFYINQGYSKYKDFSEFLKGYYDKKPECVVRTFMTIYKTLKYCSNHPFYSNSNRYNYKSSEEQTCVEEAIWEAYIQLFNMLKDKFDNKTICDFFNLGAYIKKGILQKAHLSRIIKSFNRNELTDFSIIEYQQAHYDNGTVPNSQNYHSVSLYYQLCREGATTEDKYILIETRTQIQRIIDDYLKGKDKIDTLIVVNHLMKDGIKYGNFSDSKWTLKRIAYICNATERTVQYRKHKIIKELAEIYKQEIAPLLME